MQYIDFIGKNLENIIVRFHFWPEGPTCVWPIDYSGNCTNIGPPCDCLPWQVRGLGSKKYQFFLFRPVSMTNVHHNALKTATALMVTIATNAAGKQDINKKTS